MSSIFFRSAMAAIVLLVSISANAVQSQAATKAGKKAKQVEASTKTKKAGKTGKDHYTRNSKPSDVRDFSKRWTSKSAKLTDKSKNKKTAKAGKQNGIGKLIAKYASEHGVPHGLARAVVQVESNFRSNVTGAAGEIGLMQIKLSTARGMGYKGSAKKLYNPATNLFWGMKYLGRAHQLSGGSTCGTILKYNAGHGAKRPNPISTRYCQKVQRII